MDTNKRTIFSLSIYVDESGVPDVSSVESFISLGTLIECYRNTLGKDELRKELTVQLAEMISHVSSWRTHMALEHEALLNAEIEENTNQNPRREN